MNIQEELDLSMNNWKETKEKLLVQELTDEDGYPTDAALEAIEKWHWADSKGWFEFIKSVWHYPSWGWKENDEELEFREGVVVTRFYLSTGGWSGNESIIRSMQSNEMMWHMNWVQSRRGGHYIFEMREF